MVQMIMPKMGESVAEATILKWLKKEGDRIEADEPVLEIATDKVDSEVPSPAAGILSKRMFEEGQVVKVGEVIAMITAEGEVAKVSAPAAPAPGLRRCDDPARGITMAELETISGSGMNNRVTKTDILHHLEQRGQGGSTVAAPAKTVPAPIPTPAGSVAPSVSVGGSFEIIEMDRMRKLIADHMVMSKQTSPHVTSYIEADVTNLVKWRDKVKSEFEKREKEKITYTPIFIEAVCKAIKDYPMVNISVDGTRIIKKNFMNIGMATALPSGNLIVPVIKNADHLNLIGLTKAVNDLANRARINKLKPDEIQGGTYTLTNVGTFGNVMGTPIINQPQVAILAVGAIRKKPAVIETPEGDTIGIRHMMFLSLSYDHRVVDGSLGGSFLRRIADYLEKFDINRGF